MQDEWRIVKESEDEDDDETYSREGGRNDDGWRKGGEKDHGGRWMNNPPAPLWGHQAAGVRLAASCSSSSFKSPMLQSCFLLPTVNCY